MGCPRRPAAPRDVAPGGGSEEFPTSSVRRTLARKTPVLRGAVSGKWVIPALLGELGQNATPCTTSPAVYQLRCSNGENPPIQPRISLWGCAQRPRQTSPAAAER